MFFQIGLQGGWVKPNLRLFQKYEVFYFEGFPKTYILYRTLSWKCNQCTFVSEETLCCGGPTQDSRCFLYRHIPSRILLLQHSLLAHCRLYHTKIKYHITIVYNWLQPIYKVYQCDINANWNTGTNIVLINLLKLFWKCCLPFVYSLHFPTFISFAPWPAIIQFV